MAEIIYGMPSDEYHALDRVSSSILKKFILESGADAEFYRQYPPEQTEAMAVGTAFHALTGQPDAFSDECAIVPAGINRRTKVGREEYSRFMDHNAGKAILTQNQYETALKMSESVRKSLYGEALLSDGRPEVTVLWDDPQTKLPCKARFDWLCESHAVIIDFKKTNDITPDAITRTVAKYGYHIQERWYMKAAKAVGLGDRTFMFCFALDKPRWTVLWHYMDYETKRKTATKLERSLEEFADSKYNNRWKGYAAEEQAQPISLRDYQI